MGIATSTRELRRRRKAGAMTKRNLESILKSHRQWLADAGGARANLRRADMDYFDLSDADLRKADLSFASLFYTDLRCANLTNADLQFANLSEANLEGADLRGANLYGVDFNGANISEALIDDLIFTADRIGSVKRRTTWNATVDCIWCGCFMGTLEEFKTKVSETYPEPKSIHRREYEALISYFKKLAKIHGIKIGGVK